MRQQRRLAPMMKPPVHRPPQQLLLEPARQKLRRRCIRQDVAMVTRPSEPTSGLPSYSSFSAASGLFGRDSAMAWRPWARWPWLNGPDGKRSSRLVSPIPADNRGAAGCCRSDDRLCLECRSWRFGRHVALPPHARRKLCDRFGYLIGKVRFIILERVLEAD